MSLTISTTGPDDPYFPLGYIEIHDSEDVDRTYAIVPISHDDYVSAQAAGASKADAILKVHNDAITRVSLLMAAEDLLAFAESVLMYCNDPRVVDDAKDVIAKARGEA